MGTTDPGTLGPPMRLLMLSWRYLDHPQSGGAEVLTHEVLRRLAADGHSVTCFTAEFSGAGRTGSIDGVDLVRRGRQWTVHVHAWRWLRERLGDFDVVIDQINTIPFCTPRYVPDEKRVLFICQLARGYWFRETRGAFRAAAPFGYLAEPHVMRLYRNTPTITISESSKADLVDLGFDPRRIEVIPMALLETPLDALSPKQDHPLRLIMVGRLTPAKFVEEGLLAFALLASEFPDAQLDIVGGGDERYRRRLERIMQARGISGSASMAASTSHASGSCSHAHMSICSPRTAKAGGWLSPRRRPSGRPPSGMTFLGSATQSPIRACSPQSATSMR